MNLSCNPAAADHLFSKSQKARVISEAWFASAAYCLNCSSNELDQTPANTAARDFVCPQCRLPYELKSGSRLQTASVPDGAYGTMLRRIREGGAPALMLLHYSPEWRIRQLLAIHPVFLTPSVVKARSPLSATAERRGHVLCNLRLDLIPTDGKILVIANGAALNEADVRSNYRKSGRLFDIAPEKRGWTALVLAAIRKIGKPEFSLSEVYAHEPMMRQAYPGNNNVQAKVRQQMQVLRDLGYVEFLGGRGEYRMLM